ncbi:unnamed protein product, partial [Chrysoparadoxa australica]
FQTQALSGNNPTWEEHALLVFRRGSSKRLQITLVGMGDHVLLSSNVHVDQSCQEWKQETFEAPGGVSLRVDLKFEPSEYRIVTQEKYEKMEDELLTHVLFPLSGGEQGGCSFMRTEGHTKAVIWLSGRNDYFHHPHVLDMLTAAGFDLYAVDLRRCGRAKLPGLHPLLSH